MALTTKFFLNLPVADSKRSRAFFEALGFEFNLKFTSENAGCMVLSEQAYVMLLEVPFFKTFTKREICDTRTHSEGIFAFEVESREAVDAIVKKAFAAGGSAAMPPTDHGFMYGWSFCDPDGHHWEVFWMDPNAAVQQA